MSTSSKPIIVGLGPISSEIVAPVLGSGFTYIEEPTPKDLEIAVGALVRAAFEFNKSVFDAMPNLKVIARTGVGTELVDLKEADARNIPVVITPGSNSVAVAEGVIAQILHLSKRLGPLTKLVATGKWDQRTKYPVGDLANQTLGIIGYGRIGKKVAEIASVFGLKILAFDTVAEIPASNKVNSIAELLAASDFVTLHIPLTPENNGLIGKSELAAMKSGAILINCSRGALVDLDAALESLNSGKLGGLGLDVFDPEPPKHHPIFDHENVVLTPHVMGLSNQATIATYVMAAEGVRDFLTGVKPKAIANLENNQHKQDRSTK
jgi:D-3-phosphoglycerate dehydrogenase/(S)-sulfolactate dehydrogenase